MSHIIKIKQSDGSFRELEVKSNSSISLNKGEVIYIDEPINNVDLKIADNKSMEISYSNGESIIIDRLVDVLSNQDERDIPVLNFKTEELELQSIDTYEKLIEALEASALQKFETNSIAFEPNLVSENSIFDNSVLNESLSHKQVLSNKSNFEEEIDYSQYFQEEVEKSLEILASIDEMYQSANESFEESTILLDELNYTQENYAKAIVEVSTLKESLDINSAELVNKFKEASTIAQLAAKDNFAASKNYFDKVEASSKMIEREFLKASIALEQAKLIAMEASKHDIDSSNIQAMLARAQTSYNQFDKLHKEIKETLEYAQAKMEKSEEVFSKTMLLDNRIQEEYYIVLNHNQEKMPEELFEDKLSQEVILKSEEKTQIVQSNLSLNDEFQNIFKEAEAFANKIVSNSSKELLFQANEKANLSLVNAKSHFETLLVIKDEKEATLRDIIHDVINSQKRHDKVVELCNKEETIYSINEKTLLVDSQEHLSNVKQLLLEAKKDYFSVKEELANADDNIRLSQELVDSIDKKRESFIEESNGIIKSNIKENLTFHFDSDKDYNDLIIQEDTVLNFDSITFAKLAEIPSIRMFNNPSEDLIEDLDLNDILQVEEFREHKVVISFTEDGVASNKTNLNLDKTLFHNGYENLEEVDNNSFEYNVNKNIDIFLEEDVTINSV